MQVLYEHQSRIPPRCEQLDLQVSESISWIRNFNLAIRTTSKMCHIKDLHVTPGRHLSCSVSEAVCTRRKSEMLEESGPKKSQ